MNAEDFTEFANGFFKQTLIDSFNKNKFEKRLEVYLQNNCTLERCLKQDCPFCDPVASKYHYKINLYSYGYRLGITVFNEQFYKISCCNCGISSGIHLGLEKTVEEFFKICMQIFDEKEKNNV